MRECRIAQNKKNRISPSALVFALVLGSSAAFAQLVPNLGGQRVGISAYQFLKIGADSRGSSMGEAYVAVVNDVSALFWNPAALVNSETNPAIVRDTAASANDLAYRGQAIFSHTDWLVGVQHEFFGASYFLTTNDAVGIAATSLHTDPMSVTTETQPTGTGNYFTYGDVAIAATYSRRMTDQFSFGATVRYVRETIDVLHMDGVLIDLGTFYYLGLGTSRFAVVVSNFGANVHPVGMVTREDGTTVNNFQSFSPPTMFRLGYAVEPWLDAQNRLTVSLQLNHPNDNAENISFGAEYAYDRMFFVRVGVKRTVGESFLGASTSTAQDFSAGAGVLIPLGITTASLDYAFANYNDLGAVNRITVSVTY
ncbi:MAG TPA: PorV/PorQ family protein [Bacteroidota bacterium]|nr:PorV/PorQ family protein [Bacteroidota bacterium]